jgi:hypothetical protein
MLAVDRAILDEPLTHKLKRHPNRLELWLKQTQQVIIRSKQDATEAISQNHQKISTLFRWKLKQKNPPTLAIPANISQP